jgi:hypothetical protein
LAFFSDKAWFHLQGDINMQNNRYWSPKKPHITHEAPLYPVKVGVWCAVSARRIVGPEFFKETINCERYVEVILGQFFSELTEGERLYGWYQQDSASAHSARMSMQALSDVFKTRIISSGIRLASSPYLNPSGFLFWSCLKDKVYNSNTRKEEELEENVLREIASIAVEQLRTVNQPLFRRCENFQHHL